MEVDRITADIDCEQAQEEFSALLDGELNAEDQERVESHLAKCSACLRELSSVQEVQRVYGAQPLVTAPDEIKSVPIDTSVVKPIVNLTSRINNHSTRSYRALMTAGGMLGIVATIWLLMVSLNVGVDSPVAEESAPAMESYPVELISPTEPTDTGPIPNRLIAPVVVPMADFDSIKFNGNALGTQWTQVGYIGEPTKPMERTDEVFRSAVSSNADLAKKANAAEWIIFQHDGTWFKVE